MTTTDVQPPPSPAEEEREPNRPAWRRAPIGPLLAIWAVLTVLLVLFSLYVPSRLLGFAASSNMREVKSTVTTFSIAAAPVAALVYAILLYSLFAWRHRGSDPPPEDAPPIREHPRSQVVWLVASSVLCLFLLVWGLVVNSPPASEAAATKPPLLVEVTGNQWTWDFTYPQNGGIQSDDLYLPVNQRVLFKVSSKDVVHSFWIVQMAVKVDANPGKTTTASVTPDRLGDFVVRCAELCGLYHAYMQTTVHVVSDSQFTSWLQASGGTA